MRFWIALLLATLLTACSGKPSDSAISEVLEEAAKASLVVNGFEVPASAVKVDTLDIGAVQEQDPVNGMDRYYVESKVVVALTQNSDAIAAGLRQSSTQAARGADIRDISNVVMAGAFGSAQARNALKHHPAGTRFSYLLQAVIVKVDGDWRVADWRTNEAQVVRSAAQQAADEKAIAQAQQAVAAAEAAARAADSAAIPGTVSSAQATDTAIDAAEVGAAQDAAGDLPDPLPEQAVDVAEAMAREQEAQEQAERARLAEEAQRKRDEQMRAAEEAERREIEESRRQADALAQRQREHAQKLDAEDPVRK